MWQRNKYCYYYHPNFFLKQFTFGASTILEILANYFKYLFFSRSLALLVEFQTVVGCSTQYSSGGVMASRTQVNGREIESRPIGDVHVWSSVLG